VTTCDPKPAPYTSNLFLDRICIPQFDSLSPQSQAYYESLIGVAGIFDLQSYIRDIRVSWKIYLICIPITFVLMFLWNWMLRMFAELLAWLSILIVGVGIIALGFGIKYYETVG